MGNYTDRQERIPGFSQDVLNNARIFVSGAGATGCHIIQNLGLLGSKYIFLADLDRIEDSNLSRNCLHTKADVGKEKAAVAAAAFERLNVLDGKADFYSGNIFTLGEGVFRRCDIVMGCLDNMQARIYTSRLCKLLRKPYIDVGIEALDWTRAVFSPDPAEPCFACVMSEREFTYELAQHRNSCDVSRKIAEKEEKIPTIVLSAAEVAASAAGEMLRVLHHQADPNSILPKPNAGMKFYTFHNDKAMSVTLSRRETCPNHVSYDDFGGVRETPMSAHWTLRNVLQWVEENYGSGYYLSTEKDSVIVAKGFCTTGFCKSCGKPIDIFKNQFYTYERDLLCPECKEKAMPTVRLSNATVIYHFDNALDDRILKMTLVELGIPLAHILEFDNENDETMPLFLELTADIPEMMPKL